MNKLLFVIFIISFCGCNLQSEDEQCGSSNQISKVSSKMQVDNVLRYDLSYQLLEAQVSYVKFWETKNPENAKFIKVKSALEINTTIYGLKANRAYQLQIVLDKVCENGSDIINFQTNELPYKELQGYKLLKNTNEFDGNVLFNQSVGSDGHLYVIVDAEGEVVWYQSFHKAGNTFSWTPDKTVLALLSTDELVEIDLTGKEKLLLQYGELGFDKKMHHEIQKNEKGEIYGLTYEKRVLNTEEKSKYGIDTLSCDGIQVFDSLGNKLWNWSMCHTEMPDIKNFDKGMANDWGHANAVYDNRKGDYLISFRNFNQIWSVDKSTGEVNWKFGDDSPFNLSEEDGFFGQHAVHINKNGHMMLFDNGDRKSGISRALSFDVQADNHEYEKILDVKLPKNLFSYKKGNAELINDSYVFFNSTQASTLVVSNTNDSIIWELEIPKQSYRAVQIDSLYD